MKKLLVTASLASVGFVSSAWSGQFDVSAEELSGFSPEGGWNTQFVSKHASQILPLLEAMNQSNSITKPRRPIPPQLDYLCQSRGMSKPGRPIPPK